MIDTRDGTSAGEGGAIRTIRREWIMGGYMERDGVDGGTHARGRAGSTASGSAPQSPEAQIGLASTTAQPRNNGAEVMPAGTLVHLELDKDGAITPLIDLVTTKDLLPGQIEILAVDIVLPPDAPELPYLLRAVADSGAPRVLPQPPRPGGAGRQRPLTQVRGPRRRILPPP